MDARVRATGSVIYSEIMNYKKLYSGTSTGISKLIRTGVYKSSPVARPSIVYYIRLDFRDGLHLYKIGYTSMTIEKRVSGYYDRRTRSYKGGMGLPCGCTYRIIATLYKGNKEEAYRREQDLHKLYQPMRYRGPARCRNGNTEMYISDVLGLDTMK